MTRRQFIDNLVRIAEWADKRASTTELKTELRELVANTPTKFTPHGVQK